MIRNADGSVPRTIEPGASFSVEPTGDRVLVVRTRPASSSVVVTFDVLTDRNDAENDGSPYFDVSDVEIRNAQCNGGTSSGTVAATVTITGNATDTQTVELRIEGTVVATKSVTRSERKPTPSGLGLSDNIP